jgi:hypothetical protein
MTPPSLPGSNPAQLHGTLAMTRTSHHFSGIIAHARNSDRTCRSLSLVDHIACKTALMLLFWP